MKNHSKDKDSSYLMYWDANCLYGWVMSQNLRVDGFEWVEHTSQFNGIDFNKDFMKKCNKDSDKIYILEVDVEHP